MTMAAVGSAISESASSFTLTPSAVNDFILIEVISKTNTEYATALSSSNVTWLVLVSETVLGSEVSTVFIGKVTAASSATVTVTVNTGSPQLRIMGQEFSTTAGYSAVTLDSSATVANASTTDYPQLTPGHGSGELYFGYAYANSPTTAGSTSGYTYAIDANGNGMCYDASCTSSAQQPTWPSNGYYGIAVMMYEAASAPASIGLAMAAIV
jgi:hypothetical protein